MSFRGMSSKLDLDTGETNPEYFVLMRIETLFVLRIQFLYRQLLWRICLGVFKNIFFRLA